MMHRDVKPENVMLRGGDPLEPVLIDYGLARRIESDVPSDVEEVPSPKSGGYTSLQRTYTGNAGTPGYEAPEVQAVTVNGQPTNFVGAGFIKVPGFEVEAVYGRKCDVWSLGAVLYYALSGFEPGNHDNPSLPELTKRRRDGFYVMDPLVSRVGHKLRQVVQAMMNTDVERRLDMRKAAGRLEECALTHIGGRAAF